MFYSSYNYISPLELNDNKSFYDTKTIFLKQTYTLPKNSDIDTLANSVLYAIENSTSDISVLSDMLQTILSAQCTDMSSDYFGLFSYNLKLSAEDYLKPDYDFQPLVLLPLLECYIEFRHLFSKELMTHLSEAITLSANILSYGSNLIDSHNKLLEIIFLICVGECFSIPQFIYSVINKTNSYYHFIKYNGNMPLEYNSPEQIILQLEAIFYFSSHIDNEDIVRVLNEIKDILLSIFYRHFNPHLFQWTGPFSLCRSKFIMDEFMPRIIKATNQKNPENISVPNEFRHISPLYGDKFEQLLVSKGILFPHYKQYLIATLYNTKTYSLCSFNHDDLWSRRTPCVGYFGSRNTPYCLYIQCLLNGICFSSGAFHSIQYKNVLLGHVNFSTNRGYKGIALDTSDKYITNDLRIRFCLEGDTSRLKVVKKNNEIRILYEKLLIVFSPLYSAFDNNRIKYEYTAKDNALYFDIVLYSGKETFLELAKTDTAIVSFLLYMGDKNGFNYYTETYHDKKFLYSKLEIDDLELALKSNKKPDNYEVIFSQDAQYISGTDLGSYIYAQEIFTKHHEFFFENQADLQPLFLREKNIHNKKILRKISGIGKCSLHDASAEIKKVFKSIDSFSDNEFKHYSVLIIQHLYSLATQTDRRFIRMIELNYTNVYQQLRTLSEKKQIKKIIINTANRLYSDYKCLQTKNTTNTTKIIEDIVSTINSEFTDPDLSLQNIAADHGVSESYISRKFSEYMGVSYVKYLTQTRINKAVELLKNGNDIADIHTKCGYYNAQTFNTAFKKTTGFTVKSYICNRQNN